MTLAEWKEREKEQRCNDILEAAMKLFYKNGYDSVSMSDIAEKVGIKKPTLYLYFKNKESLFFTIVMRGARIRNDMTGEAVKKCKIGREKLGAATRAMLEFNSRYPEYFWADSFLRSGRFDFASATDNEEMAKVLDLQREIFNILSGCIRSGIDDGAYLSDADPLTMAVLLAIVAENVSSLRPDYKYVLDRGNISLEKFGTDTARLMRRAIAGENEIRKR